MNHHLQSWRLNSQRYQLNLDLRNNGEDIVVFLSWILNYILCHWCNRWNVRFITEKSYFSGCTWSTGKLKRTLVRYACNLEFLSTQFSVWNLGIFQSSLIRSRFKVHTVCLLFIPLYKWRITWNHAIGPFNSGLAQINQ